MRPPLRGSVREPVFEGLGAKGGMVRWCGIPATSLAMSRRNGSCVVRFTRPGDVRRERAPRDRCCRRRRRCGGECGLRNSARGIRLCRWRRRRRRGNRSCSLCRRGRDRASALTSSLRQPSLNDSRPWVISQSRWARPRVECSSSRVTRKLGHITPPSSRRHLPTPTQRRVACGEAAVVVRETGSGCAGSQGA